MKKIYLDMNIFEDCHTNRDVKLKSLLESMDKRKNNFFYSPAHMEELAVILRIENDENKALKYIYDKLLNISRMTDNFEFLPSYTSIITKNEHPFVCFKRVIEHYDSTLFAEENEEFVFSLKNQDTLKNHFPDDNIQGIETFEMMQKRFGIDKRKLNSIAPEKIFLEKNILEAFDCLMSDFNYSYNTIPSWNNIKKKHSHIESIISLLYNFLEKIGYKSENQKKLRSRMHDVSHGIYGTASDILITGDDKFYNKTKAIYTLLNIPTAIYNKKEFINYTLQTNN